jgi:hypothetical protein
VRVSRQSNEEVRMPERTNKDGFPLADLIQALSDELKRARDSTAVSEAAGRPAFISWATAQIEVGVTWTESIDGGIDFKVLHLGGDRTKENTTTMTVTLVPAIGGPVKVAQPSDQLKG